MTEAEAFDALIDALKHGDRDEMRRLITAHQIDLNTPRETMPLHLAACNGLIPEMEVLLECGARTDALSEAGSMAIHGAAYHGHVGTVRILVEHGADKNAPCDRRGIKPLRYAGYIPGNPVKPYLESIGASAD